MPHLPPGEARLKFAGTTALPQCRWSVNKTKQGRMVWNCQRLQSPVPRRLVYDEETNYKLRSYKLQILLISLELHFLKPQSLQQTGQRRPRIHPRRFQNSIEQRCLL